VSDDNHYVQVYNNFEEYKEFLWQIFNQVLTPGDYQNGTVNTGRRDSQRLDAEGRMGRKKTQLSYWTVWSQRSLRSL